MRILLVEDDPFLGSDIKAALLQANYQVQWQLNGQSAIESVMNDRFGAIILNFNLPQMSGIEVLKRLRQKTDLPIILISSSNSLDDRIEGLEAGADDYVIKPFAMIELLTRLRTVMRRSATKRINILQIGELSIDDSRREVYWFDQQVRLGRREYILLLELANNVGKVLTRAYLERLLYGLEEVIESNALEVHIHHLRRKLSPSLIVTLRGIGYRLEKEPHAQRKQQPVAVEVARHSYAL